MKTKYFFLAVLLFGLFSQSAAQSKLAPMQLQAEHHWVNQVRLTWGQPTGFSKTKTSSDRLPWTLLDWITPSTIGGSIGMHSIAASDGKYIYIANWISNASNMIYRYTNDGILIDYFTIEGLTGSFRDLAFDGRYFYGAVEGIRTIFVMDFNSRQVVRSIPLNNDKIRNIAYARSLDEGKGGLYIGDDRYSMSINLEGKILQDTVIKFSDPCYGSSYHDGKYYAFVQPAGSENTNGIKVVEYDLSTNTQTGQSIDLRYFSSTEGLPLENSHFPHSMEFVEDRNGRMKAICGLQSGIKQLVMIFEIDRKPLPPTMIGYQMYRNGTKIGNLLNNKSLECIDTEVEEGKSYTYGLKAVYPEGESEACETTIVLADSKQLPFYSDFDAWHFGQDFWTRRHQDSSAWHINAVNVIGTNDKMIMATYNDYGFARKTNDDLTSRPLHTRGKKKIMLRYQAALDIRHPEVDDTLFIEVFNGISWICIHQHTPKGISSPLMEDYIFDVSEHLANKENVQVRFRVFGPGTNSSYTYYINEVKLWSPLEKNLAGKIKGSSGAISGAEIHLSMHNDIITYTDTTDKQGMYNLSKIESGRYKVRIKHPQYNTLEIQEFIFSEDSLQYDLDLKQPKVVLGESSINIKMSPNKNMHYTLPLTNNGDGEVSWKSELILPLKKKTASQKEAKTYSWPLIGQFDLKGNAENKLVLHQGYIYTYYAPDKLLMQYSKEGEYLGNRKFPNTTPYNTSLISDGKDLYSLSFMDGISNICRLDWATLLPVDSIRVSKIIQYACYDPRSDGFFAGSQFELYLIDRQGNIKKTYNIGTSSSAVSVALDTVTSSQGHCLWIYGAIGVSGQSIMGEDMGIYQFLLDSNKYSGIAHTPKDLAGYTPPGYRQSYTATNMVGSYDYLSGRYCLIGSFRRDVYPFKPSQIFIYDMGQSIKWINVEKQYGKSEAGKSLSFLLNFNTEETLQNEVYEAQIRFSFSPQIDDLFVPVTLTIDTLVDKNCFVPIITEHSIYLDEYVDIRFDIRDADGSIVSDADLLGYNVRRNNIKLNDTLITENAFRDLAPLMGNNIYQIQAVYSFNCESFWSKEDTINVSYIGECNTVSALRLEVVNQRHIVVQWDAPENKVDGIMETYEKYKPFELVNNLGGWELHDLDRGLTYEFEQARFPNEGEPMSFMVFNPSLTSPKAPIEPFEGSQVLACFSNRVKTLANNDWLISPKLSFDHPVVFNFKAKSQSIQYGAERIKIGYSMKGKEAEDFIWFQEGKHFNVPGEWEEYSFSIPTGAKHVVINCVSVNSFILLLDNLYIGIPKQHFSITGYDLYRNGAKYLSLSPKTVKFNDFSLDNDTYSYEIVSRYTNGCISKKSEAVEISVEMNNRILPARNLRADLIEAKKKISVSWNPPAWSDAQLLQYHDDTLSLGLGLVGNSPPPFYVAAAFLGSELQFESDYSFSGIRIGLFDSCDVTAFVMSDGEFLTQQKASNLNFNSMSSILFDYPVKIDLNKVYLVGYYVENYAADSYPVASDNGPVVVDRGNFISFDGMNWQTTTEIFGDEYGQNWTITAVLEIVAPREKPNSMTFAFPSSKGNIGQQKAMQTEIKEHLAYYPPVRKIMNSNDIDPIEGYQLFKNGTALQSTPIYLFAYEDNTPFEGQNTYWVSTHYKKAGAINSDTVEVYFNPTSTKEYGVHSFNVYYSKESVIVEQSKSDILDVTIFDLHARPVRERKGCSDLRTEISLQGLSKGTYIVVVQNGHTSQSYKIIVL